ncbi:uncharacterized protein LOC131853113 [Achroia grisella]|uniref:uncharacterized protein LOC131853113 n=1 Tax=Achroia grisella TaxID=688607 RepID=UPI0027D1FCC7|nr:uncharacterized protein LOC131853113 [Achroia grisella]
MSRKSRSKKIEADIMSMPGPACTSLARYLRPERFELDPSSTDADIEWTHWLYTFNNFLSENNGCKAFKAEQYRSEYIRDAFIAGISSHKIRQRLLENLELSLDQAFNQALSLEMAETNSRSFNDNIPLNAVDSISTLSNSQNNKTKTLSSYDNEASTSISGDNIAETIIAATTNKRCFFCGSNVIHQRIKCPALNSTYQICFKKGHFANVCRSKQTINAVIVNEINNSNSAEVAAISAASLPSLHKATVPITINKYYAEALIDTGSSLNFVNEELAHLLKLKQKPCQQIITSASLNHTSPVNCYCNVTLQLNNHSYDNVKLLVVRNLCADIILGHDLLKAHHSLELKFGGLRDPLKICNVMAANLPHATLFSNLSPNVKPVAIKSRRYSEGDQQFIKEEVEKLLKDGIIEPSISPWRAQVLVTGGGIHRKRLVIDYSQTINKFTELDAYPLPNIEVLISKIARNKYFSQIDLKSAYHQVPIQQRERPYTAFEACGNLFQFTRIPFGVTNEVSAFQRTMQFFISNENLTDTYVYLDDVTVYGKDKLTHDANLAKFMATVAKYKITLNKDKCNFGSETINILGYTIENNVVRPDKERLKPLLSMPAPTDINSLKRVLGMFANYSKRINNYSEKISNLATNNSFPLSRDAEISFESLKKDIANAALIAIDDTQMFTVETDASEHALAATLSQNSRPVAFFSRLLTESERNHSSIEKEARTTPYNPEGNGQVERLNGTLWRTIQLSLRSKNLDIRYGEDVLPLALHSIRSLLCTATNATPHEMFCFPRRSDAEIYQTASENENLNADNSGSELVHSPQRPVRERRPPAYLNDYES